MEHESSLQRTAGEDDNDDHHDDTTTAATTTPEEAAAHVYSSFNHRVILSINFYKLGYK
jgi:hypothetical protein